MAEHKILIDNCEDAWNESVAAGVTSVLDNADYKVGAGSAKISPDATVAAGTILATEAMAPVDLSDCKIVKIWIKRSVDTALGNLQILLDNHASCASPEEALDVPALSADVWSLCDLPLVNPESDTAIISVGLKSVTALGACDIRVDDVNGCIVTPEHPQTLMRGWYPALDKSIPVKVSATGEISIEATVADIVSTYVKRWGKSGTTELTDRDISLDLKALTDDSIKGLLRSLSDIGVAAGEDDMGLLERIGELKAAPTANTLLARLADLKTLIVLAAGTNLIGKVNPQSEAGAGQTPVGVTVTAASTQILAANANRKVAVICNDSDTTIYLAIGVAAQANKGIRLNANGGVVVISRTGDIFSTEAIYGILAVAGNKTATAQELN